MAAVALEGPKPVSPTWRNFREALRRHPTAIVGGLVLLAMIRRGWAPSIRRRSRP